MNTERPISIRRMDTAELERLAELDRSEHVTRAYEIDGGALRQAEVDWKVPAWSAELAGEHSLAEQVEFCRSHLDRGGILLGAFNDEILVGVAVVRPKLRDDLAQLAFLHVSRRFRRLGIAAKLMGEVCDIAREAGAQRMYVSSIPSSSAVGFYLDQGCRLAEEVDPELFAHEPEDIHLIMDL